MIPAVHARQIEVGRRRAEGQSGVGRLLGGEANNGEQQSGNRGNGGLHVGQGTSKSDIRKRFSTRWISRRKRLAGTLWERGCVRSTSRSRSGFRGASDSFPRAAC